MKITIDLEEELFAVVKRIGKRTGYDLSQIVADLVRRGLAETEEEAYEEWEDSTGSAGEAGDPDYEP